MDNNDSEYIDRIVEAPDDDAPRLQYADYLTSQNDPRGEFIRVQCAIAKRAPHGEEYWTLKQRELDLLAIHGPNWRAPVRAALAPWSPGTTQIEFQRGFVESFPHYDYFGDVGPELLEKIPTLRHLVVTLYDTTSTKKSFWEELDLGDKPPQHTTDELSRCKRFGQIDQLRIKSDPMSGEPPTSEQLAAFLGSPWLRSLKSLQFYGVNFDRRFSRMLGTLPVLKQLRELEFHDLCGDSFPPSFQKSGLPNTLESFAASGMQNRRRIRKLFGNGISFPRLKRLDFDSDDLDDHVATAWSKNGKISPIESLHLKGSFGDKGAAAIVRAPWAARLKTLSLSSENMQDKGLIAIAGCPAQESLEELEVQGGSMGVSGAQTLARSSLSHLRQIRWGAWDESEFGREHARAFVEAPWWSQLKSFVLWKCSIDFDAAEILGKNWPPQLESLRFIYCDLNRGQIPALFPKNRPLHSLRSLAMPNCEIAESELVHLSGCDSFPRLLSLDLGWNVLSETGMCEMIESSLAERVRILDLREAEEIGERGFRAMSESSQLKHLSNMLLDGCDHAIEFEYERLEERFGDRMAF
jgi:uncharacterized protein (TIGR02996 family)